MTDSRDQTALVRLLQLVSPALPVGAYAYSQGLEHAVEAGWVKDRRTTQDWILGVLEHNLCSLDLPVLRRLYAAWQKNDSTALEQWSRFLCASRETAELLAEDRQLGVAMARLLNDLKIEAAASWVDHPDVNWAVQFALAATHWQVDVDATCQGYAWAWCENQVAAAIKLVPLGQTDGQRILSACAERIPALLSVSVDCADEDVGQLAPALAIGSALHERQYSRLFRS